MLRTTLRLPAVVGVAAAALVAATSAGATGRYVDKSADAVGSPDITSVSVASDVTGQILFTISVSPPPQGDSSYVLLALDTDLNGSTGSSDMAGADYVFGVDETGYSFAHWTGSEWADTPTTTVRVSGDASTITISVNRSELGNTGEFNFWVGSRQGDPSADQYDDAPNDGLWNYSLQANGPEIQAVMLQPSPLIPRAGKPFAVKPVGLRLPQTGEAGSLLPAPESYSCRARLAGKVIAGRGVGGCTWQVPKTAKGKRLAVVVTVSYEGTTISFPFAFPVAK
jgi:hypothetical protein